MLYLPQEPRLHVVTGDILRQNMPELLSSAVAAAATQAADSGGSSSSGASSSSASSGEAAAARLDGQEGAAAAAAAAGAAGAGAAQPQVKVVANLPYYITKDCLLQASPQLCTLWLHVPVCGARGGGWRRGLQRSG